MPPWTCIGDGFGVQNASWGGFWGLLGRLWRPKCVPGWSHNLLKVPLVAHGVPREAPGEPEVAPRTKKLLKYLPNGPPDPPKTSQNRPKSVPRPSKILTKSIQMPPDKTTPETTQKTQLSNPTHPKGGPSSKNYIYIYIYL